MSLNVLASEAMTRLMVPASGWSAKTLLEKMFSEGKTYLGLALGILLVSSCRPRVRSKPRGS